MKDSFNALRIVNKRAKLYSKNSDNTSKLRSSALYELKYNALLDWVGHTDNIELHYIDNKKYYCFYYKNYSFHVPFDEIYDTLPITEQRVLHDFESNSVLSDNTYRTEKKSLTYLYNEHNLNANNYLLQNSSFETYWPYLPM
jgi:hypothetical protein